MTPVGLCITRFGNESGIAHHPLSTAGMTGFEPAFFRVTGERVSPLHHKPNNRASYGLRRQGPCTPGQELRLPFLGSAEAVGIEPTHPCGFTCFQDKVPSQLASLPWYPLSDSNTPSRLRTPLDHPERGHGVRRENRTQLSTGHSREPLPFGLTYHGSPGRIRTCI